MNIAQPTFRTVQRRQLAEQVIQQLQERISLGELAPGTKLPTEPELMVQLGVGRSTIREAMRVLAHAGLLEVRQGDGTYVLAAGQHSESLDQRLRRAAILEVYEVRHMLELELASLAAVRRSETDLAQMRDNLERRRLARERGDHSAFLDADIAFHLGVAQASKNSVATDLYSSFSTVLRDALAKLIADPASVDQTMSHQQLYEAIASHDAAAAKRWTAQYLDTTMQSLRQAMDE